MRVIFGAGKVSQASSELGRLKVKRALILSTPEQAGEAQSLATTIGDEAAATFSNATMHTLSTAEQEPASVGVRPWGWTIHSGAGTGRYGFFWSMAGDNQDFTEMNFNAMRDLR